ncbi:MAG TPA: peptidoglycan-binding protein [Blastocatellia bacterium]|nr:peptidoglycan-binding protein [Blastocatellia bacterium]
MKPKKHLVLITSIALVAGAVHSLNYSAQAQDTRPRYNSPQYADRAWTLPSDTVISVQMNSTLSSRTARVGDKFIATVTVPVYVNGQTVIPAGTIVEGRVTQVTPAKRMNRSGTIGIDFDDLVFPNGSRMGLVGGLTSSDPETRRHIDDESRVSGQGNNRPAVFIGGGGAIGAVLGGIAGGGKGAVLGGVAGAGAGVAGVLLAKGEEAQVPAGTPFGVQLKQPLVIREGALSETAPTADNQQDQPPDVRTDPRTDQPPNQPVDDPRDRQERTDPVGARGDVPDRPDRSRPETRSDTDDQAGGSSLPLSSPEMVRRAQIALKDQGYYEGESDGVMSPRTSSALRAYQKEHRLSETGDLDPQTAKSLGIVGAQSVPDRGTPDRGTADRGTPDRADRGTPDRPRGPKRESAPTSDAVMATVLSATANRTGDGAIYVLITTQANSGGWRWFGEQVVNGDTLEVYARAVKPTGMVTQVLTRGRIELTARDGVQYVRRVVIHSAGGDQAITLGSSADTGPDRSAASVDRSAASTGSASSAGSSLQRKAEDLLAEYQRAYGVRMTGSGFEVENASQYRDPEIELLFAIDGFANAAQLYARLAGSLRDRQSMHGATLALARQARRTDRVITTTTSRAADSIAAKWDSVRQDVLRLMQTYNINSSEIEN